MVGGAYTMGAMVFKANYMEGEVDNCVGADCENQQWTVGMDYNLSKRTGVYALYSAGENVTFGGGAGSSDRISSGQADLEADVISVGVTHSF
jgi:predicted porin